MKDTDEFQQARVRMVEDQLLGRDITAPHVLEAMRAVPRHVFVPADLAHLAYADAPLPIGHRQTISQPYIVALMAQLCAIEAGATVLEIGTGSGYQAAVLAHLARQVYTVERIPELAQGARELLARLAYTNIEVIEGDGSEGLPAHAPFDAILVAAAAPRVPEALKAQLAEGGILALPVGGRMGQALERWVRQGEEFTHQRVTAVAFVPLVGAQGWPSADHDEAC